MKVLYTDLICPSGHVFYNNIQISYIAKKHDVDFIFQEGYAAKLNIPTGCKILEIEPFQGGANVIWDAIRYRVYMWKYQRYVAEVAQQGGYDVIFVSSFETFSFCLTIPYECLVVAICHNNIDYIQSNRLKRYLFKRASNIVRFVALNRATSDYFKDKGIKHILASHGTLVEKRETDLEKYVFVPTNECIDIKVLNYLQSDSFLDWLQKRGLKLYVKEKFISVNHDSVLKLPNYISQKDFDVYMRKALAVFLPYDNSKYKYRSSGLFYEAIGRNKAIIVPDNPNFRYDRCKGDAGIFLYEKQSDIPVIISNISGLRNNVTYEHLLVKMESDIDKLI